MDLTDVANIIAVTALLPIGLFIFFYGTEPRQGFGRRYSRRWKATSIGRALMVQAVLWFLFLLFVLQSIFLDYALKDVVRVVVYTALVTQFWVVFATLRHIQKNPPIGDNDGREQTSDESHPHRGTSQTEGV